MNIAKMMKQAQKMQQQLAEKQSELASQVVSATAGGGKISVTATAGGDILSIKIDPDVVDASDVEFLEDLVLTGVNQAIAEGRKITEAEMGKLTAGLGLPPGLGL